MRSAPTFTEEVVRVGHHAVYLRQVGEGPPVLLLNGIGAHTGMWAPLEGALDGLRAISFDAPGTGRSRTPGLPLTLDQLAALAEATVRRLGYERVDVVGYSFGGLVAQRLARRAPELVRRLVLAATSPGWGGVPGSLLTLTRMATPLRYYWRGYYEAIIGELMGGQARSDAEFVRRHGDQRLEEPPHILGYAWQLAALALSPGSLPWLGELEQPTLVVAGDDDPVMPMANALLLAHRIPTSRLVVAPGEGHLLLLDAESPMLPAIAGFLRARSHTATDVWRDGRVVTEFMVDEGLRPHLELFNPIAAMSAAVRYLSG